MSKTRVPGIELPGAKRPSKRQCSRHLQLDWRMDPEESYSDWTLVVRIEGTQESQQYNVHRAMLVTGHVYSMYFEASFRSHRMTRTAERGSTDISLTDKEAQAVPILLDYMYGIHKASNSVEKGDFEALLSVADYLQIVGMDVVIKDVLKSCKSGSERGTKKFMHFLSILQEYEDKAVFVLESFDLLISEMARRVLDDSFSGIDLSEYDPIAPRLLGSVLRKCVHEISQKVLSPKGDYEIVLDFLSNALNEKKRTSYCLPKGLLEKTFDDQFWNHLKTSALHYFCASVALRLLNWEFQFGESQDGDFSSFQTNCMEIIAKAYRRHGSSSMNDFLFRLCDNDFDQYVEWCKYIPSGCLLRLMECDLRSGRSRSAFRSNGRIARRHF